jgi:CDGSH-type Zn-finger protein
MDEQSGMKIVVSDNGPYVVTGSVPLSIQVITANADGESWEWTEARTLPARSSYKLCRCGHSATKPFCDQTHRKIGFDGTETASRAPYAQQAEIMDGPTVALSDAQALCAFARFCDAKGQIWSLVEGTDDPATRSLVIREAHHCPSGRLVARDASDGRDLEEALPPSIALVEDPGEACSGPLWVRGGITIESADGRAYERRARATLCRCGASNNKPFCDGTHASVKFQDALLDAG